MSLPTSHTTFIRWCEVAMDALKRYQFADLNARADRANRVGIEAYKAGDVWSMRGRQDVARLFYRLAMQAYRDVDDYERQIERLYCKIP